MLDLEAEIRPCPKSGPRFRPEVIARGGKAQFPYLVDEQTGIRPLNGVVYRGGAGQSPGAARALCGGRPSVLSHCSGGAV